MNEYESFSRFQIPERLALISTLGFSAQQSAPKQVIMSTDCMRVCVFSSFNTVLLQFYAQFYSNSVQIYHCKNYIISLYFYHSIKFQLKSCEKAEQ